MAERMSKIAIGLGGRSAGSHSGEAALSHDRPGVRGSAIGRPLLDGIEEENAMVQGVDNAGTGAHHEDPVRVVELDFVNERRFSAARNSAAYRDRIARKAHIDVLQVVLGCPAHGDFGDLAVL